MNLEEGRKPCLVPVRETEKERRVLFSFKMDSLIRHKILIRFPAFSSLIQINISLVFYF